MVLVAGVLLSWSSYAAVIVAVVALVVLVLVVAVACVMAVVMVHSAGNLKPISFNLLLVVGGKSSKVTRIGTLCPQVVQVVAVNMTKLSKMTAPRGASGPRSPRSYVRFWSTIGFQHNTSSGWQWQW